MNVCICTSSFPINKQEVFHRYLAELINILHSKGHRITILTQNRKGGKELFIPHAEVVWFPWKMTTKDVLAEVSFKTPANILSGFSLIYNGIRYSKKIEKDKKIDIFLCMWIVPSGLYICFKNIFGKTTPYILWSHGSDVNKNKDNFFTRALLRLIIRRSKAVFANGFKLCDNIEKIAGRECKFLPVFHKMNIPETSAQDYELTEQPIRDSVPKKETTFLFVGRLSPVKGPDILIDALKLLDNEKQINYKCYIIGDGEMMLSLVREVNQSNLQEKIIFLGKITDEREKANYFNLADCIIIPSRSESIPVVLSEAVLYHKPLIVTNVGDMELIVRKYNLGLVAEKENVKDLADKIRKIIAQPMRINPEDRKDLLNALLFESNAQILLDSLDKN